MCWSCWVRALANEQGNWVVVVDSHLGPNWLVRARYFAICGYLKSRWEDVAIKHGFTHTKFMRTLRALINDTERRKRSLRVFLGMKLHRGRMKGVDRFLVRKIAKMAANEFIHL